MSVFCLALILKLFFIGNYRIPQNGMYPGLPAGSRLFAAKRAYSSPTKVKRGDIVVFVREENGIRYNYIWRVIGLPGDKVEASSDALSLNGELVKREHVREENGASIYREHNGDAVYEVALNKTPTHEPPDTSVTVPFDQFFVMGDNRFDARDSRYFGSIPFGSIIGRKL
jgi:signal peptidase I